MLREVLLEFRLIDTSRKSLRSFGLVVGSVLVAVALWLMWPVSLSQLPTLSSLPGIVGITLVILGLALPGLLRLPYLAWMFLATILGAIMTRVVLTLVFVIVVTPTGLIMRLLGKDPLNRRIDPSIASYWVSREDADWSAEGLEKYY